MEEFTNMQDVEENRAELTVEEDSVGNIEIAPEVVSTIVGITTGEIEGVAGMHTSLAGGIVDMLSVKKNPGKGVKVDIRDKNTVIDLYIIVEYGVRIPELAWEIQESVKSNVETMTGLNVEKVNIHIEGVSFAKAKAEETALEEADELIAQDEMEDIPTDGETMV